jgi:hypothetical protein
MTPAAGVQELGAVVLGQARLLQEQAAGLAALEKQVGISVSQHQERSVCDQPHQERCVCDMQHRCSTTSTVR